MRQISRTLEAEMEKRFSQLSFELRLAGAAFVRAVVIVDHKKPGSREWKRELEWLLSEEHDGLIASHICEAVGLDYAALRKEIVETGVKRLRIAGLWEDADALLRRTDRSAFSNNGHRR